MNDDGVVCVVSPDKKKKAAKAQSQPELGGVVQSPTNKVKTSLSDGLAVTDYV